MGGGLPERTKLSASREEVTEIRRGLTKAMIEVAEQGGDARPWADMMELAVRLELEAAPRDVRRSS